MFELSQVRPLQQRLVLLDRAANLSLFPIQIAENEMNLEWVAGSVCRSTELLDRGINLIGDKEIQAQHVVRRLESAPPIDPPAILELVALPCLADGETRQQCEKHEERDVGAHQSAGRYSRTTESQRFCARRTISMNSRTAPRPPRAVLTQCTVDTPSAAASAGAAESPTRLSTGRSSRSSPM